MFGHVATEFALCGLPKGFSREVPTMCFDGVARVSRAAAQLAFLVAGALDVYQGKAVWNGYIDSLASRSHASDRLSIRRAVGG